MRPEGERLFVSLLLALGAILCFSNLSGRDLWEPNEPIPAEAAREMWQRGDWLLPTVNGELYPDKPPLLFWGIWLASLPAGRVTETSARLPSALAGTGLVLALYFLTRRALGPRGAFLAAASLAVSTFFVEQARYVQHDMLLLLGLTGGTLCLFRIADGESPRAGWIAAAALFLGFGVLAKGPVALALPAMMVAADTLFERRLFRRWGWLLAAGLLALIPAGLYYALLVQRHGAELVQSFLFRHNVDRFVEGFDHLHPWWFFFARTPTDLLPVSLFLPAALFLRPEEPARRRLARRMWIWILVPLIFFSFSASKRPIYLLPALPAAAILCGAVLDAVARDPRRTTGGKLALAAEGIALAALGTAGAAAPLLAARRAPHLLATAGLLAAGAVIGSILGLRWLARGKLLSAHGFLVGALAAVWIVAIWGIYPALDALNSPRKFSETLLHLVPRDAPLRTYGLYRFRSGYLFYTGRLMPRLPDRSALQAYLEGDQEVFCVLPKEDFESLRESSARPFALLAEGSTGRRKDCLISNRPATPKPPAATRESPGKGPSSPGPGARSGNGS
ncbi:MAG TPA: glycosyltransferase family 39 protein [Candidatus Polarisedimenticolia bacterium]|jgi:4-amino-4-deoxy-L-arabinose transferase-like glycosyltransferase|nr:glycosyltransferase family 39 protein [Candidatus Polarisedimenticolia bacterium]